MLLLIDIGNTRLKWAIAPWAAPGLPAGGDHASKNCSAAADGNAHTNIHVNADADADAAPAASAWLASGAVTHPEIAGIGKVWAHHSITAVLVSNVAGVALAVQVQAELAAVQVDATRPVSVRWFTSEAELAGVQNRYQAPERLGCDRLAAMIGARTCKPGRDLIVATCGTATTVDALTADGVFIGGMILPGLATMARSLARGTALLPELAQISPPLPVPGSTSPSRSCSVDQSSDAENAIHHGLSATLFADHTEAAIRNGCLAAQAGAIERAAAAHGNAFCLLSGGAAAWVAPWLQVPHAVQDNLVLLGLQAVAVAQPERFSKLTPQPEGTGATSGPKARTSC